MASASNREFGRGRPSHKENQPKPAKGLSARPATNARENRGLKRTVLGSITNNVRIQPSRAAKSAHDVLKVNDKQDENAGVPSKIFSGKPPNQPFSIYVDQDPPPAPPPPAPRSDQELQVEDIENQLPALNDAIMQLPKPSESREIQENDYLDMSGIEEEPDVDSDQESLIVVCEKALPSRVVNREAVIEELPEYSEDIYSYLLTVEHRNRPRPGFMQRQEDVTLQMRSILIDWLVEVAEEYKLQRETLFLAVTYIDRFLSHMSVMRSKLQLVGAAAMFLAAKYEEIYPPDVNEFVYITDDTYQKKQILRMEHLILKVLNFDIATATINWFAERLLKMIDVAENAKHLTMFIIELVLVEYDRFLIFPSSLLAASALCLANYTLPEVPDCWPVECETVSRYSLTQLIPCVSQLYRMHKDAPFHVQQAVREKYRLAKFNGVADVRAQPSLRFI